MDEIIVIGTVPQCPRCKLLGNMASALTRKLGLNATVRHLDYKSAEAEKIAGRVGLRPGTAKDVAKAIGKSIDTLRISELTGGETAAGEYAEYNDCGWTPGLDAYLRPMEDAAEEAGILMTPVLVVNGAVKHKGSVPSVSDVMEALLPLVPGGKVD